MFRKLNHALNRPLEGVAGMIAQIIALIILLLPLLGGVIYTIGKDPK